MKKEQFLQELEALLMDLPWQERKEAIQYYRDYFDDAGPGQEEQIIAKLGSPQEVAYTIKADLGEQPVSERVPEREPQRVPERVNGWKIACIVLLCILLFPVLLPLGIAALAVAVGLVAALVGIVIGIGVTAFSLLIAGVVVIGVGIAKLFFTPAEGAVLAGVGSLVVAVGILSVLFIVWCGIKVIPWLIRGIVKLLSWPFQRRGAMVR